MIDTGRCIACHTIEREPDTGIDLDGWIFGCDACQSCCPLQPARTAAPQPGIRHPLRPGGTRCRGVARALDERQFTDCFGTTPLTRSGLERIRGNIRDKR